VSQAEFDGPGSAVPLEHSPSAAPKPPTRSALSLLRELDGERRVPQWRHWIVGVEPIGRITLPADARQELGVEALVKAVSRDLMLVLRRGGVGASLPVDRRGRLVLPAWLRQMTQSSGSVLVAARSAATPTVVVSSAGVLDGLLDHIAGEGQ